MQEILVDLEGIDVIYNQIKDEYEKSQTEEKNLEMQELELKKDIDASKKLLGILNAEILNKEKSKNKENYFLWYNIW